MSGLGTCVNEEMPCFYRNCIWEYKEQIERGGISDIDSMLIDHLLKIMLKKIRKSKGY